MHNVPETSQSASNSGCDKVNELQSKIVLALSEIKEGTYEDLAFHLQIEKSKVWKRLSELAKTGLIYRPGTKKALRSGRAGFVWRLTEKGAPNIQASEKALKGPGIAYYSRNISNIAKSKPLETYK